MHVDIVAGTLLVVWPGDQPVEFPLPPGMAEASAGAFRVIDYDLARDRLVFTLVNGVDAVVELGRAEDPLAGRAVVYLDQNHWSAVAAARQGHRPADRDPARAASKARAAARLAEMVEAEEIVLPLSGGHAVESVPLSGDWRVLHVATMLELSRGWQILQPARVRAEELRAALHGGTPAVPGIATLGADVLFANRLGEVDGSDLPGVMGALLPRLVNVSSIYAALLDPEPVDPGDGPAALKRWADVFAQLAAWMKDEQLSREQALRTVHGVVMVDFAEELAAMASRARLEGWLPRSFDDVSALPFVSRYRAVMFARMRNGSTWRHGDFVDINYLCCAAAYADVVVGESRTIADLATARGLPPGAQLARTLEEAVEILEARRHPPIDAYPI